MVHPTAWENPFRERPLIEPSDEALFYERQVDTQYVMDKLLLHRAHVFLTSSFRGEGKTTLAWRVFHRTRTSSNAVMLPPISLDVFKDLPSSHPELVRFVDKFTVWLANYVRTSTPDRNIATRLWGKVESFSRAHDLNVSVGVPSGVFGMQLRLAPDQGTSAIAGIGLELLEEIRQADVNLVLFLDEVNEIEDVVLQKFLTVTWPIFENPRLTYCLIGDEGLPHRVGQRLRARIHDKYSMPVFSKQDITRILEMRVEGIHSDLQLPNFFEDALVSFMMDHLCHVEPTSGVERRNPRWFLELCGRLYETASGVPVTLERGMRLLRRVLEEMLREDLGAESAGVTGLATIPRTGASDSEVARVRGISRPVAGRQLNSLASLDRYHAWLIRTKDHRGANVTVPGPKLNLLRECAAGE